MAIEVLPSANNLCTSNNNAFLKDTIIKKSINNKCSCGWVCNLVAPIIVGLLGLALVIMGIVIASPIVGVLAALIVGFSFLLGYMAVRRMSVEQLLKQVKHSLQLSRENELKMERSLTEINEVNTELHTTNTHLQLTQQSLKSEVSVLKTTNTELQKLQDSLHRNIDRLEERNGDLEKNLTELQAFTDELKNTKNSLQAHVLELEQACSKLNETKDNLQENNNQLANQITSLSTQLNKLTSLNQSFERGFSSQIQSFQGLNFSLQSIEKLLSTDEKEIRTRSSELNNLVSSLSLIDTSLASSSSSFKEQQKSLKEAIASLQSFLAMVEKWCNENIRSAEREMCKMLKEQKTELQKELSFLRQENLSLSSSSSELKGCIQTQKNLLLKNEEQIERLALLLTEFERLHGSLTSTTEGSISNNDEILRVLQLLCQSFEAYKSEKLQESSV